MATPAAARAFLDAADEHPAGAFDGIDTAVDLVLGHVRAGSRITVHGDYDVDGVCSTAVLVRACGGSAPRCDWYLPSRLRRRLRAVAGAPSSGSPRAGRACW